MTTVNSINNNSKTNVNSANTGNSTNVEDSSVIREGFSPRLNSNQKFEELVNNRKVAEEELKSAANDFNSVYLKRLRSLYSVGNSVLNKCFSTHGDGWRDVKNIRDYLRYGDLEWFFFWNDLSKTITRVEIDGVHFHSPMFSTNPKARELRVPRKFFHMSDRDFAKIIRRNVNRHKAWHRVCDARNAAETISDLETEIEQLQRKINRLQKDAGRVGELVNAHDAIGNKIEQDLIRDIKNKRKSSAK